MSNAPKRPTIDDPSQAVIEWIDAANAYIDHLEQRELEAERDEAVAFLHVIVGDPIKVKRPYSLEGLWMTGAKVMAAKLLSRIDKEEAKT